MNAIETLYLNAGLITEDGYVKVRDGLWVASSPYKEQKWHDADKSVLPTKEELHEICLNLQELILIQESCGFPSLRQILNHRNPWAWSSTEHEFNSAWMQRMSDDMQGYSVKGFYYWVIPIRRSV